MKKTAFFLGLSWFSIILYSQCGQVLPTSDFSVNFCRFPFAWQQTQGENAHVNILTSGETDESDYRMKLQLVAPEATVETNRLSEFINRDIESVSGQVFWICSQVLPGDYDAFLEAVDHYPGAVVVIPAYFGPMDTGRDYTAWRGFIREAWSHGAIIAGSHGDMYQLGDLSYWKGLPVDVFAVMGREINGFGAMMPDYKIGIPLENSSYMVAGAAALLKSSYPGYTSDRIREIFHGKSRQVHWSLVGIPNGKNEMELAIPHFRMNDLGKYEDPQIRKIDRNVFSAPCLDAGLLFDMECPVSGGWCLSALNVRDAWKSSTGRGIKVAILDHTFNKNHPALKGRIDSPVSFIEGVPALSENTDHGTTMAADLVMVAPDVRIMPVVTAGDGHWGDANLMIKGILYAVDHGADIICCSQMAVKDNLEELDEAVRYASEKGVTFVYINYEGDREEVVIPCPVEFYKYQERKDITYVIGTNFTDNESPVTWGVSHTAPVVAGVIALMKQVNPSLVPSRIKDILLASVKNSIDGAPVLDANMAISEAQKQ